MAQLTADCFAFDGKLMTTGEALALLDDRLGPLTETEPVALRRMLGRILAEDVIADRSVPPHDNSAVDGYAVFFDDLTPNAETRLKVTGRIAAGHPLDRPARRGAALRVFTGAPMPEGPDTVLMQEDCSTLDDHVVIPTGIVRGANRRCAGEDVESGRVILHRGQRLRPQDIGLAASIGRTRLQAFQPLRVALFSTGDEIREIGSELPPGCVFDANRHTLMALLEKTGCEVTDLGILADRFDDIKEALEKAAASHDLVLTSGGVSAGEEDHVRTAVEALGALHFWRLAIRPGRPIAWGQIKTVPFVGLPGNPVAMMVTFLRIARPAILKLAGCEDIFPNVFRVRAAFDYKKKRDRREWIRVRLVTDGDGQLAAVKFPRDGAGILSSMVEADGLVELAEDVTQLHAGVMVDFLPFSEVS